MQYTVKRRRIIYAPMSWSMKQQAKPISLSTAVEGFLLACRARKLSPHTLSDYERTLRRFIVHVGDSSVQSVSPTQVDAFLAAQPYTSKTVLNYHIGLSAFWTWATKHEYTNRHIMRLVEKPRPQQVAVEPFSEVDVKALLSGIRRNAERDRAIIMLLLDTGLRASELCSLDRTDIDLTKNRLKVLGKGNKERLMLFSPRTASALFRYFATLDPGVRPFPFTRTSLTHLLQKIGQRSGVPNCHAHRFRHTFAINYIRNGGDPYTLQDILGHSTMEMVRRYLALAQVDIEAAHRRASPVEHWKL